MILCCSANYSNRRINNKCYALSISEFYSDQLLLIFQVHWPIHLSILVNKFPLTTQRRRHPASPRRCRGAWAGAFSTSSSLQKTSSCFSRRSRGAGGQAHRNENTAWSRVGVSGSGVYPHSWTRIGSLALYICTDINPKAQLTTRRQDAVKQFTCNCNHGFGHRLAT